MKKNTFTQIIMTLLTLAASTVVYASPGNLSNADLNSAITEAELAIQTASTKSQENAGIDWQERNEFEAKVIEMFNQQTEVLNQNQESLLVVSLVPDRN